MTTQAALDLCERVLSLVGDDGDANVSVSSHDQALLRFAANQPIQHSTSRRVSVSLGLKLGDRYGEAQAQAVDEASLKALVAQARQQAELLPPAPQVLPTVGPQTIPSVAALSPNAVLDAFDAEARAAAMAAMVAPVKAAGFTAAGIVTNEMGVVAKATTNGMRGAYESASVDFDMTVTAPDSTGRASAWGRDPAKMDPAALGAEAVDKAKRSAHPVALDPGTYRIVLSPYVMPSLLYYLAGAFNARAVKEGRTWVSTRLGKKVAAAGINLWSDASYPVIAGCPFDGDGLATKKVALIRDGVVGDLLYDRKTAAEDGVEPTGASGGGRNSEGAGPASAVLQGGNATEEDLLAAVGDGVLLERIFYSNWVNPSECVITGMTRDGLQRIRGGKLAEPLKNMRFNISLLDLLNGVLALGKETCEGWSVAPALASTTFTLSTGTSF